jgi:hypothetical protein
MNYVKIVYVPSFNDFIICWGGRAYDPVDRIIEYFVKKYDNVPMDKELIAKVKKEFEDFFNNYKERGMLPQDISIGLHPDIQYPAFIINDLNTGLYVEVPNLTEKGTYIGTGFRPAIKEELFKCLELFQAGKCNHSIFQDEPGYMYDHRSCAICGEGIGEI